MRVDPHLTMRSAGHRLRGTFENMIGHIVRFQCTQNVLGPSRLVGSPMSNYQIKFGKRGANI